MPTRKAEQAPQPVGIVAGVEGTLDSLASSGRLDEIDVALIEAVRSTAAAVEACERDADASFVELAGLYRVHLLALDRLRGVAGGSGTSPLEALAAALSTPLGDRSHT